jgi:hypothetical protein
MRIPSLFNICMGDDNFKGILVGLKLKHFASYIYNMGMRSCVTKSGNVRWSDNFKTQLQNPDIYTQVRVRYFVYIDILYIYINHSSGILYIYIYIYTYNHVYALMNTCKLNVYDNSHAFEYMQSECVPAYSNVW